MDHDPREVREPFREHELSHGPGERALAWTGTLLGIVSLGMGLSALLFTFAYLGIAGGGWPPAGVERPDWGVPALATAALLGSLVPALALQRTAKARSQAGLQGSAFLLVVLGLAFLGLQATTYADLPVAPTEHAYGSVFVALVGVHHVFAVAGIVGAAMVAFQTWGEPEARTVSSAVSVALYWYAIVAFWALVAFVLYVSPTFFGAQA